MSCCNKLKCRINAYIYGKCGINKSMIRLSRNLDTIKCMHKSCNICPKCGVKPCNCSINCRRGNCDIETKIRFKKNFKNF